MKLKIATYNIQCGTDYQKFLASDPENRVYEINLNYVTDFIREQEIEVCCLNEIAGKGRRGNQPEQIADALGYYYAFANASSPGYLGEGGEYGNAIVSKYPILSCRTVPVTVPEEERAPDGYYEPRALLITELDVNGKNVTAMTFHFGLTAPEQEKAVQTVLNEIRDINMPLILAGDFNLTPDSPYYTRIAEHLTDTSVLTEGGRLTFPSVDPGSTIDYVFTNGAACPAVRSEVVDVAYYDHRPIIVELKI